MKTYLFHSAVLLALGLTQVAPARANEFGIEACRLSPRAAIFYGDPWNNAVLAIATPKGIVVMDSSWSETVARGFRTAIEAEFKRTDFACLINTHEHWDHVGGNGAFADLPIVGHDSVRTIMLQAIADPKTKAQWREFSADKEIAKMHDYYAARNPSVLTTSYYAGCVNCYRAMEADFHGSHALVPPTLTFDRRLTLHYGDVTFRLVHLGGVHSVGDTLIIIPEENVVMIGQIFFSNLVPVLNRKLNETTTPELIDGWFAPLHEVLAETNDQTQFITCSQRRIMKRADFQRFLTYTERLWRGVREGKASGKTLDEVRATLALQAQFPEFAAYSNVSLPGTEWEILDIHGQNIAFLWSVLGGK